jgi:hypothetical protein
LLAWKYSYLLEWTMKSEVYAIQDMFGVIPSGHWVELSISYGRRSVDQFVLVSGSLLGPMTRFYPYPFFSDNCFVVVLPVGRPLWREDKSVTYSAIPDWSGHWGPITIHYRLIWDRVPSSSPLTTRRDCGGGILTRLHTGITRVEVEVEVNVDIRKKNKHTCELPWLGRITRNSTVYVHPTLTCVWQDQKEEENCAEFIVVTHFKKYNF